MSDGIKRLVSVLTNGRPMTCVREHVADDTVNHKPVNLYVDQKGRRWLAQNRWGTLRVEVPDSVTYSKKFQ